MDSKSDAISKARLQQLKVVEEDRLALVREGLTPPIEGPEAVGLIHRMGPPVSDEDRAKFWTTLKDGHIARNFKDDGQ